jgi:general secretion pathway protein D
MMPHTMKKRWLGALMAALLLASCAQQTIRNEATTKLREGNFESAIADLQSGITQYPESPILRAGLVAARSEAIARLVAQISQFRALGQFDEADNGVQRALALEPDNTRLLGLQADLQLARRLRARLEQVNSLITAGKKDQALRWVESALRDAPRQAELVALQRRLELELRLDSNSASQRNLAEGRLITLDFRNAPLSTVLEAITRGSGINFILDRDVRQDSRVTLFLRGAKVDDAIELVTGAHQLARRVVDGQTVLIYPNTPEKQREHQEQVIRVFHLSSADAKATAALLRAMLRIKDPFIDEQANLIAIRETPDIVALAERLVALHDVSAAEVMLDVEILEVKTSRLTELGINFPNTLALTPLPAAGAAGLTVSSLRGLGEDRVGVSVAGLLINLRREVGDFNILANPRIRTKSREKARIMIGDKVPVVTTTTSATGFVGETVSYLDVGLKLEVEPVVAPDDDVTIKLALEVSTVAREVRTASGSLAYQIGARNANTTLRLRDGETQLLAGLISNEDRSTANRVPGLGDLPIAGRLFSSQKDDVQRTELVLAITPRILRSAARPDIAQAEMWVGTEAATRLRAAPNQRGGGSVATTEAMPTPNPTVAGVAPAPGSVVVSAGSGVPKSVVGVASALPSGPIRATWQAPTEIKAGEPFTVTLDLASGTPLRGAPMEIAFPAQALEILEVIEGGFFKQDDGVTSFTQAVNTSTGRIGIGVLRNDATGAIGQAALISLRLRAKTPGPIELSLTSLKPISLGSPPALAELPVLKIIVK